MNVNKSQAKGVQTEADKVQMFLEQRDQLKKRLNSVDPRDFQFMQKQRPSTEITESSVRHEHVRV